MNEKVVLFHPYVPESAIYNVAQVLRSRYIGQGPRVDEFEKDFSGEIAGGRECLAVGSGTDALHLAYILAGIKEGDEVIAPVFTCTATNIPLLYLKAKILFADIDPTTMCINTEHMPFLISERTKAIVVVHYGGCPCDMDLIRSYAWEHGIAVIEDAAQAVGATYAGKKIGTISEYTTFSFQAIKNITTGDGGMLVLGDNRQRELAERIRWFGIDRKAKLGGTWENNIREIGYKYQMTDIAAAMGQSALDMLPHILNHRRSLFEKYSEELRDIAVGLDDDMRKSAAWLFTIIVDNRKDLQRKLLERGIESGQVHYRNDRYDIMRQFKTACPHMDAVEDKYLVLPLHMHMDLDDVERICNVIHEGW